MGEKLYRLYCEICNWKLITNGNDDAARNLYELKTAPIPAGYPKWDEEKGKIVVPPSKKQIKKFRCPGCGRAIRPVQIEDLQGKADEKQDIQQRVDGRNEKDWSIGRKESTTGLPIQGVPILGLPPET